MPKTISPEDRIHAVYEFTLQVLELSPEHEKKLNDRGFSSADIKKNGYRTLPVSRIDIAAKIAKQFDYDLSGVPGFWRTPQGRWDIAGKSGIIIPVRDLKGRIAALKVRVDKPSSPSSKYLLLSSNPKADRRSGEVKYPQGTSASIAVHYPAPRPKRVKVLRITEGELKADITTSILPEYTVSLPGVSMWRMGLDVVKELKPEKVLIAFDSDKDKPVNNDNDSTSFAYGGKGKDREDDWATNQNAEDFVVGKALGSLYLSLRDAGVDVEIEDWPAEAGKGIDDVLMNAATDKIRRMSGDEAEAFARELLAADLPENWVYVVGVKRFYNTHTGIEMDKEQFGDRFCHEEKGHPALKALKNPAFPKADLPVYRPMGPMMFEEGGRRYYNTWRANPLQPRKGSVKPFLEHCEYILPDEKERNVLLDWLAYNVQFPGSKILWAVLLQGAQGTGKSYFGTLMRTVLGADNVSTPTNDVIHEVYTAWQKSCQLVIIEEIMARGRLELMNKLKPMITQEVTVVREMHKPAYEQPNVFNLLMFTNHEDAIILDKTDRRYCVFFSPAEPREHSYYEKLWDWTHNNASALLHFLQSRDLSNFQPKAHAPMTNAKKELIKMSVHPLQGWIAEGIAEEQWPFMGDLVSTQHLADCLPRYLANTSAQAIGRALKAQGCVQLGQVKLKSGAFARVWSVRRHEVWASAEPSTIAAEYEKWGATAEPGGNPLLEAKPL